MKFENIEIGKVYGEKNSLGVYYVIHKTDNYAVVLQHSTVHLVTVPMFFSNNYDFSEWIEEEYSDYFINEIYNRLVVRKNDDWADTLYLKD